MSIGWLDKHIENITDIKPALIINDIKVFSYIITQREQELKRNGISNIDRKITKRT